MITWVERRDEDDRKIVVGLVDGREYLRLQRYRGTWIASHRGAGPRWTTFCQAARGPNHAAPFRRWFHLEGAQRAMEKMMAAPRTSQAGGVDGS